MIKHCKTQDEDGAESRMLDEYDYEYIDDDDATLELEDVAERLKRFEVYMQIIIEQHKWQQLH